MTYPAFALSGRRLGLKCMPGHVAAPNGTSCVPAGGGQAPPPPPVVMPPPPVTAPPPAGGPPAQTPITWIPRPRPAPPIQAPPPLPMPPASAPRTGTLPADVVGAMLDAATSALALIDSVMKSGTGAAAAAAAACRDALVAATGDFQAVLAELRAALASRRDANVSAAQVIALEAFIGCADAVAVAAASEAAEAEKGGLLEAIIGVGVPAAGALLVAL